MKSEERVGYVDRGVGESRGSRSGTAGRRSSGLELWKADRMGNRLRSAGEMRLGRTGARTGKLQLKLSRSSVRCVTGRVLAEVLWQPRLHQRRLSQLPMHDRSSVLVVVPIVGQAQRLCKGLLSRE